MPTIIYTGYGKKMNCIVSSIITKRIFSAILLQGANHKTPIKALRCRIFKTFGKETMPAKRHPALDRTVHENATTVF